MKMFPRRTMLAAFAGMLACAAGAPSPEQGLKTTTTFRLRLKPSTDPKTGEEHAVDAVALAQTEEVLRQRLFTDGIFNAVLTQQPPDRLTMRCEGLTLEKLVAVRQAVVYLATLDFRTVHPDTDTLLPQIEAKKVILDPAWIILPMKEAKEGREKPEKLIVKRVPEILGDGIKSAHPVYDPATAGWGLSIDLTKEAGDKFFEITRKMRVGIDRFAILLDGKILSAPTTNVAGGIAGSSFLLKGKFTEQEVHDLASALMNPLRNPVVIEEESVK